MTAAAAGRLHASIEGAKPTATLHDPKQIRDRDDQRADGRPTGGDDAGLEPGIAHASAPTVAPEEEGGTPTTEHAPGSDL